MVPSSTVNITGFRNITPGSSFIKDCFSAGSTSSEANMDNFFLGFIIICSYDFMLKYSAMGPSVSAGKNDRAVMMMMTAKVMMPNVNESVRSVPADSGMYFLLANSPTMAKGPMMGKYLAMIMAKPVVTFQKTLLSPRPSNPLPLLAVAEVYSYNISEKP